MHQNLPTALRCHIAAFEPVGGALREMLCDRIRPPSSAGGRRRALSFNRALIDLARYNGFHPKVCKLYRAKRKGKVERPFQDFFLARSFRNLNDLKARLRQWLDTVSNPRKRATMLRVVNDFAEERPLLRR